MKIRHHDESHVVELQDGSRWRMFPDDLVITLLWNPETDLTVVSLADDLASHALMSNSGAVRVIPADQRWLEAEVANKLSCS